MVKMQFLPSSTLLMLLTKLGLSKSAACAGTEALIVSKLG